MIPLSSNRTFNVLSPIFLSFIFAILYLFFYPPIYAVHDEALYAATSYILRQGTLDALKAQEPITIAVEIMGKRLPFYPLGTPLLLLPFTWFTWKTAFLMGLFCHLAGAWIFRRVCIKQGITDPLVFALYLFFPSFVFFSRTIMSDIPSLLVALLAYEAYFSGRAKWQAGVWLGAALFFRSSNGILALPFFSVSFYQMLRNRRKKEWLSLLKGYIPILSLNLLYNWLVYGSPFLVGYAYQFTGMKSFAFGNVIPSFTEYFTVLNAVYPLMLIVFFLRAKKLPTEWLSTVIVFLSVFSLYFFFQKFPDTKAKFVLGNRYLFPAIPFLIAAYGQCLAELFQKYFPKLKTILSMVLVTALIGSAALLQIKHQGVLNLQKSYKDYIYSISKDGDVLLYDDASAELILKVWGNRIYKRFGGIHSVGENIAYLNDQRSMYLITRESSFFQGGSVAAPPLKDASLELSKKFSMESMPAPDGFKIWKITGTLPIA